jgi:hypothetical protein
MFKDGGTRACLSKKSEMTYVSKHERDRRAASPSAGKDESERVRKGCRSASISTDRTITQASSIEQSLMHR